MLFTDGFFLFYFLPATLILHRLTLGRSTSAKYPVASKALIFVLTLVFYGWRFPWWVIPFLFSVGFDFLWASLLLRARSDRVRKAALAASILQNLALLALFKYRDFLRPNAGFIPELVWRGDSLPYPAGISFYTFESLSFVIDVYRRRIVAPLSASDFFSFIGMFPRFIAGPITRAPDMFRQMQEYQGMDVEGGLAVFILGLFLKVGFADRFAVFVPYAFGTGAPGGPLSAALGVLAFSMQLYFDFSGYSLMAIGVGRCLGFRFPSNFDRPYLATSLTDFWRRWHQTLSFWFRDYLYIPLGGNRGSKARTLFNVFVTMVIAGIWHGSGLGFVLFGAWNGLFLCLEKVFPGTPRIGGIPALLSRARVLGVFWSSLIFFRAGSLARAFGIMKALVRPARAAFDPGIVETHVVAAAAALAGVLYCFVLEDRILSWVETPMLARWQLKASLVGALVVSLSLLFSTGKIPFLYFQF